LLFSLRVRRFAVFPVQRSEFSVASRAFRIQRFFVWTPRRNLLSSPAPLETSGAILFYEETMGYKYKPSKSVAKRFKVTKTGKVKRHHCLTSHLMSSRSGNKRRKLRKSAILSEGHARNMRRFMGMGKLKPNKVAHERALAAAEKEKAAEAIPAAASA
jgi:large subunit ribosomal protein L35